MRTSKGPEAHGSLSRLTWGSDGCTLDAPGPSSAALDLPPLGNPREERGPRGPRFPFCVSHPRTTQASPQGTNRLGGGLANRSPSGARAGWPRAGTPPSYCLQTPAAETGIPDSRGRPLPPLERGQTPASFPEKVHLAGPIAPSLSPLPPYTRHLASHQLGMDPKQTQQSRLPPPPGHGQGQPRALTHRTIPPTLLPLYKEKSQHNLACVLYTD